MGNISADEVGAAYDEVAELYTDMARDIMAAKTFDRVMLDAFAELVPGGPVVELGCGPGRVAAYLAARGLDISGTDISARMIEVARREYPGLRFEVGSLAEPPAAPGTLAGIVAWYSLIHTAPQQVPDILDGFHRALRPGGHLLLAFQGADDGVVEFDHRVVRAYRWSPDRLGELARDAGFTVKTRMVCAPDPDDRFDQGYLLAVKPPESAESAHGTTPSG